VRRLLTAVAVAVLLASCASSSPQARLQERANALVEAANAGDSAALRTAADLLQQEVKTQEAQADLTASKAQALQVLITRILANAASLDQTEPTAIPTPSSSQPSPSPSPSPTPSQEPSPSPSPTQAPPSSEPPPPLPSVVIGSESPRPSPSQS